MGCLYVCRLSRHISKPKLIDSKISNESNKIQIFKPEIMYNSSDGMFLEIMSSDIILYTLYIIRVLHSVFRMI